MRKDDLLGVTVPTYSCCDSFQRKVLQLVCVFVNVAPDIVGSFH